LRWWFSPQANWRARVQMQCLNSQRKSPTPLVSTGTPIRRFHLRWEVAGSHVIVGRAKLTGTPTARGLFVTFLPSRPLTWGFRMFFRSKFPTFRPWGPGTTNSEYPFIDFGLASSPKSQLLKIAKTQKP
jgi:hypothetical protein